MTITSTANRYFIVNQPFINTVIPKAWPISRAFLLPNRPMRLGGAVRRGFWNFAPATA
jgi:hypothetical protein